MDNTKGEQQEPHLLGTSARIVTYKQNPEHILPRTLLYIERKLPVVFCTPQTQNEEHFKSGPHADFTEQMGQVMACDHRFHTSSPGHQL